MAITLDNGKARITIRPDLGAGATGYDFHDGTAWQPIFRRMPDDTDHPFQLSNIVLAPFSGRVSGGGFTFDDQFHAIERNMASEKYPIHGSTFLLPWAIVSQSADRVVLTVSADGPGPFRYDATMTYALDDSALTMQLDMTNRGVRLPYGLGFHPWFVRDASTLLAAPAAHVWLEQEDHLPKGRDAIREHPDMDFNLSRALPQRWINNWLSGWNRRARIDWPARGIIAAISASATLDQYVVFSPAREADFFCFEPVSHPVDAFNLPDGPTGHGMRVLERGETMSGSITIGPEMIA